MRSSQSTRAARIPAEVRRPFARAASSARITRLFAAAVVLSLLTTPLLSARVSAASGPVLASIERIDRSGLRQAAFRLQDPTPVHVECTGVADSQGRVFLAQGWILNLETRKPAWTLKDADGSWSSRTRNTSAAGDLTLPAGAYAVYFAAYGGSFPLDKKFRVFGLELGQLHLDVGPTVSWDKEGTPEDWGITVSAQDPAFVAASRPDSIPGPYPGAMIRLLGLGNSEVRRVRIDLDRPVDFKAHFAGEYSRKDGDFVDAAWINDRSNWDRVWEPDMDNTELAGGADKNRRFDGEIRLPQGSYLLTVATDRSHATGDWNETPPWDPQSWGMALHPADPGMRGAVHLALDQGLPEPALALAKVGDNQFLRKTFTVSRKCRVLIRALGENSGEGYADFGWCERVSDDSPVWHMREQDSYPAGGAHKNRMAESVLTLPPGDYALCYVTDDSHSFGNWNTEPPWEPEAWGISLAQLDPGPAAISAGPPKHPPTEISLAPAKSGRKLVKSFDVTDKAEVLLIAVGEGTDERMTDYGWLTREDTGEEIWRMTYSETVPAGGGEKNRMVRKTLTLQPGSYSLHFVTDDSHAFGEWNDLPPDQPELWGMTLVEKD